MLRTLLTAIFLTLPAAAIAQTQLERLEAISEEMNLGMAQMMVREIEAAGGNPAPVLAAFPDTSWDDEYRAAGTCMLDQYNAIAGQDGTNIMLDRMEAMNRQLATATMDSFEAMDIHPDGMSEEQSMAIAQSCGIVELSMRRMQESGFSAAMMQAFSETQGN
ncbi:MAG: hypothetical protein AAF727_08445 [Pseudomonadota bacterium]